MSRKITLVLLVSLFFAFPIFANDLEIQIPQYNFLGYFAAAIPDEEEAEIPESIRNNEFYRESMRLTKLAHDTFEFGDYDVANGFAEEAIRFAELSDEFVAVQLIAEAKRLIDWADNNNIATQHPNEYSESKTHYEASVESHSNAEWSDAISSATKSIKILAAFETGTTTLPKQYTVRAWVPYKDCLYNIAGYSWIYGDTSRWRVLYEANKSKLPDPNNPDLIEPGMVLDIPSIRGEVRQGMWRP